MTMKPQRASIRATAGDERGQTLVEFALVAPLLLLVVLGIIQFGIAFKNSIALADAVRSGARAAVVNRSAADPAEATRQAVLGSGADLDSAELSNGLTIRSSWQPGSDVTVTAKYPYSIDLLGLVVVKDGFLTSTTTERLE